MQTKNVFVAYPQTEEEAYAPKTIMEALKITFEISKQGPYNPDFVANNSGASATS